MNKKFLIIGIILIVLFSAHVVYSMDNIDIYIKISEDSVSISDSSFPFFGASADMANEIMEFTVNQTVNSQMSNEGFIEGINNISHKYGYSGVNVHIDSILGDGSLPLLSGVIGTSMEPTLHTGDKIVVNRTRDVHVGDIVTCNDTEHGLIVKRVGKVEGDNIYLESDNKTRTYQLTWYGPVKEEGLHKWVTRDRILGIVVFDLTKDVKFT